MLYFEVLHYWILSKNMLTLGFSWQNFDYFSMWLIRINVYDLIQILVWFPYAPTHYVYGRVFFSIAFPSNRTFL